MSTQGTENVSPLTANPYTDAQQQERADEMMALQMARLDPDQEDSAYELAVQAWTTDTDVIPGMVTPPRPATDQCIACGDNGDHFLTTYEHSWCNGCLNKRFRQATNEECMFPPQCCHGEIQLDRVERLLDPALAEEYGRKAIEYRTANRTYCHGCRRFIPPDGDD
ncbi:hypothetical protein LTR95_004816 [Oleoguttula sp. CCFEE 5521]